MTSLVFRTAQKHVRNYNEESREPDVMQVHREAMDCWDCEAFLQLGIDAFAWIEKASEQVRRDIASGDLEPNAESDESLDWLYRDWLKPVDCTEKWIARQIERGYRPANLVSFRSCVEKVRIVVGDADKMAELALRVPPPEQLDLLRIDLAAEWRAEDGDARQSI